jgi:PhzF family phenazine biosynthesis protein
MGKLKAQIINAFTFQGTGGNPAAVVLEADRFDTGFKQHIAAQIGLSETAFVSTSQVADFKLEFFTPTRQIAHCGHATIAAFSYLVQLGHINGSRSSKETIDGNRDIFLNGEIAYMEQTAPHYESLDRDVTGIRPIEVLASLAVAESALLDGREPLVVNTGNSFMIIPMKDERTLAGLKPDWEAVERISEALNLIGYYPFTLETRTPTGDAVARMFAPQYGIKEEAATGMAAGPLASFLYDHLGVFKEKMVVEQGRLMSPPSPSELLVELEVSDGRIRRLIAGGRARVMKTIELQI